MANAIKRLDAPATKPLAVFERPLTRITPALRVGKQLRGLRFSIFAHNNGMAQWAAAQRDTYLAKFASANAASLVLHQASYQRLERKVAAAMVGTMLGAFGAKPDAEVLAGMLDLLEGDETAIASEMWRPLQATPAMLALACRKLIATAIHPPRAAELHAACWEAGCQLKWAREAAEELVDFVRRCDALLLEFAHDEWSGRI